MNVITVLFAVVLVACVKCNYGRSVDGGNAHDQIMAVNEVHFEQVETSDNVYDKINSINKDTVDNLVEGDIAVPSNEPSTRSIAPDSRRYWSLPIPYTFDSSLSSRAQTKIKEAMDLLKQKTSCIDFRVKVSTDQNWLRFFKGRGCYSYIGKLYFITGGQDVSIGRGCERTGVIIHEIMHALGFSHEQSRPDRGRHVSIFWENIKLGEEGNFDKHTKSLTQGLQYDFGSIMHYGKSAFSKNGKNTIQAIQNHNTVLGQRNGPSDLDITGIDMAYCSGSGSKNSEWSMWSDCGTSTTCQKTRQRFYNGTLETDTQACPHAECYPKVNGHWGRWSQFSSCSVYCGGAGTKQRTRICDNPAARNGGDTCPGPSTESQTCNMGSCNKNGIDSDFENGIELPWQSVGQHPFQLQRGPTLSTSTGPNNDHTLGNANGYYIYLESSSPAKTGQTAILKSDKLKFTKNCTMEFYYHMFGPTMGKLEVKVGMNISFEKSGNQGNVWHKATVEVPADTIQFEFIATRGPSFSSDVALDDITFNGCEDNTTATTSITKPILATTGAPL